MVPVVVVVLDSEGGVTADLGVADGATAVKEGGVATVVEAVEAVRMAAAAVVIGGVGGAVGIGGVGGVASVADSCTSRERHRLAFRVMANFSMVVPRQLPPPLQ